MICAPHQRPDHRARHVALGVLRLLGGGRDGVEADVGEEDERRPGRDPPHPFSGVQFSGRTQKAPTATKKSRIASFRMTMTEFARALPIPMTRIR